MRKGHGYGSLPVRHGTLFMLASSIRRYSATKQLLPCDSLSIPLRPSWSVHELLGRYPAPSVDANALTRLHKIAALDPPPGDSPQFKAIKEELEQLVKLVEAVKLVPQSSNSYRAGDGMIWPAGTGLKTTDGVPGLRNQPASLLKHAAVVKEGAFLAVPYIKPK